MAFIYSSEPTYISNKNEFDPYEVAQFKNRALLRHEKYNGLMKNFFVLEHSFRHKATLNNKNDILNLHGKHFRAVGVLVQTQLDNGGFTLWDVYP